MNYTVGDEYVDDDDYVCFRQTLEDGREIFWTLHHDGWNAFRDWEYEFDPFDWTGRFTFPDKSELDAAASARELNRTMQQLEVAIQVMEADDGTL